MARCTVSCLKLSPAAILVYFCLLNMLMYADRGILSALIPTLEKHKNMGLNDLQSGVLGSVFMLGFMIVSPIFANASQTYHPFSLIYIGAIIWGISAFLAAISRDFWMLLIARAVSGIGEASFVTLAGPIILEIAPASKKNLWISIYCTALTIGFALGYVITPPIENVFGGWYYLFYLEAIVSIPFIVIPIIAYKDPRLIIKSEVKLPITTQFKILSKNPIFVNVAIGLGAYGFTTGGIGFWGPTILQRQFKTTATVSTFSLGSITIVSGLAATVIGSCILDRMTRKYREQLGSGHISEYKFNCYRTEKSTKLLTRVCAVNAVCAVTGAVVGPMLGKPMWEWPLGFFLIMLAIAEFFLFL